MNATQLAAETMHTLGKGKKRFRAVNVRAEKRMEKEAAIAKLLAKGYNRVTATRWYRAVQRDNRIWKHRYSPWELDRVHEIGYLAKNIDRLGMLSLMEGKRITDLDYLYLRPMNNSFSKWIEDLDTMNRVLVDFRPYLPEIYFSIVNRGGLKILEFPFARRECKTADIMDVLRRQRTLQLRPAFWLSKTARYKLEYIDKTHLHVNNRRYTTDEFWALMRSLKANYVICQMTDFDYPVTEDWDHDAFFKFYLVHDNDGCRVVCALAEVLAKGQKDGQQYLIDRTAGTFTMDGRTIAVPHWALMHEKLVEMAEAMPQLLYYSISVVPTKNGFLVSNCSHKPILPRIPFDDELNDFLKRWVEKKKKIRIPLEHRVKTMNDLVFAAFVRKYCRPGIRPYMQKLWFQSIKSDLFYKGTTLPEKLWCWKRGFLSHRIEQYGLTEENYRDILSDYDYHWLNRMNNVYQTWINDKTTFRHVMEPLKEYIPDYYFSVFMREGELVIARMQDCPEHIETSEEGILQLLREEKKLTFKASAGTHGDGFYCLEYHDNIYWINGERAGAMQIKHLLASQKTYYLLTSYINMHPALKKIYPTSVNSIRIMTINRHGYDPMIMQTYMRIGSARTGYTDNVGYGGICAMVDLETGRLYDAETIKDHVFYPCPNHPDTGEPINGTLIPHWALVCEMVAEICMLFPELEYLGFDVAVTEEGFQVMEINIHQDLHKVARHSEEIRAYFRERIAYKKRQYAIQ